MDVRFYNFNKKMNSTKIPNADYTEISCTIKSECSINSPILQIKTSKPTWNYCYIQDFARYYFIDDWRYNLGLWECSLSVDVLASYATAIKNSTQYIERSNVVYDNSIIDTFYPAITKPTTSTLVYDMKLNNQGTYVLGIVSGEGVNYYWVSPTAFNDLMGSLFAEKQDTLWGIIVDATDTMTKTFLNVFEYIASCIWLPLGGLGDNAADDMYFGYWNSGIKGVLADKTAAYFDSVTIDIPKNGSGHYDFLNSNVYASYELFIPAVGSIPLDANIIQPYNSLEVSYSIDLAGRLIGKLIVGGSAIQHFDGQLGVEIQLSQNGVDVSGILGSATAGLLAGVATSGASAFLGVSSGLVSAASYAMPTLQSKGAQGSFGLCNFYKNIVMKYTFYKITSTAPDIYGYPAMKKAQLKDNGYYKCNTPVVDFGENRAERQAIIQYMTSGFYIE